MHPRRDTNSRRGLLSRRSLLVGAVAVSGLTMLTAACGGGDDSSSSDGPLTLYSGRGEDLVGPVIEDFTEATGIEVEVRYGDSAEMLLLIQEEGDNSPADVYYSQGAGFLGTLSDDGGLADLPAETLDKVPDELESPNGDWVGVTARARTVVYNTEVLSDADLPDSILDYTDSKWKGKLGWAPTNASFQDQVTAMRAELGDDETRAWLEGIVANEPLVFDGNSPIVEAVGNGEIEAGFVNHYYLYRFLTETPDFPAANHFSAAGDPGGLVNVAGAGILSTSDNTDAAQKLVDYLVSTEAQEYFANTNYELPVVNDVPTAEDLPKIDTLNLPDFDLNKLDDLQGTVDLLTEVGAL